MTERCLPYLITEVFCAAYAVIILGRLRGGRAQNKEERCLRRIIIVYLVLVAGDSLSRLVECTRLSSVHLLNAVFSAVAVTAVALGCYLWLVFVEARLQPHAAYPAWLRMVLRGSLAALCALDLVSAFTGWVFCIDAQGRYALGPLFWVQSTLTTVYLLLATLHAVYSAFRAPGARRRREYLAYAAAICLGFFVTEVEDYVQAIPLLEMCVLLAIQILFLTLYLDREYQLARQERELSESRMSVMLSQIQPHFLYNTLTVIQEMCSDKAPEAAATTVQFAEFLRGNLSSLTRKEPIPFEQELHHTQVYLALEQKRFGEKLQVEYAIGPTGFSLPALTLQPIAENAVQHGVSEREGGGRVRISTRETAQAYLVIVEDDGVGYDTAAPADAHRTHIGIDNVRSRLALVCGGTLTLQSTPGSGTTAIIAIPREGGTADEDSDGR